MAGGPGGSDLHRQGFLPQKPVPWLEQIEDLIISRSASAGGVFEGAGWQGGGGQAQLTPVRTGSLGWV